MAGFTTDETLRRERAATAAERAREFEAEGGKHRLKRGLFELTLTMNSEEARDRSKYLDRRIREAAGLELVADERETEVEPAKHNPPASAYWDGRLIKKHRHAAQWENKLQGGRKEPPQRTRRKKETQS